MNSNVEEVKSRLNIVDVVGEYVRLTKAGANWKGLCPFHHEKSPSFMVNEEKQIFHCFGCTKGGDVISFVMEMESLEFREALKILAEKAGVELEEYKSQDSGNKKRIMSALELSAKFYETQLWKGMGKDKILKYLHDRGLNDESIKKFRLGYAPNGWDNIIKFLSGRGYSMEEIFQTGLLVEKNQNQATTTNHEPRTTNYYDRFRNRIMFPIMDIMDNVIGYSARVAPGEDESQAKYINTPETAVYHKSKALYGISQAKNDIKKKNCALLVEGNTDVIACSQAGIGNVVAVSGTALTSDQITILKRYAEKVSMLFDMDNAGQQAAQKSVQLYLVNFFEKGLIPSIVFLKNGKDAAEVAKNNPQDLLDAISKPINSLEYFLKNIINKHDKGTTEGKNLIIKEWSEIIGSIPNEIPMNRVEKVAWSKKLAQEIDVEEKVLLDVLRKVQPASSFEKKGAENNIEDMKISRRFEVIRDSLLGVIMGSAEIWKETCEKEKENEYLINDSLVRLVLNNGPKANFSFEALLSSIEDERIIEKLRKIYFDAKYQFTKGEVIEYSQDDLRQLAEGYKTQYVKELQKERLHSIIRGIENAEHKGDKETLAKLMSEFTKLSQEM